MKRWVLIVALAGALAGCGNEVQTSLWQQIKTLSEEKTDLTLEVERLRREDETLAQQVSTLAMIDKDVRRAGLSAPEQVRIGRHSGLYNKTEGQTPDRLVVYVEPMDAAQDTIKAAGRVQVELWNLAAAPEEAKLAVWQVEADDLKTLWGRGLLGAYYRLMFPLEGILKGDEKDLTLTVRFTDYLTGKILTDQKVLMAQ
jgi:hypothetical protein